MYDKTALVRFQAVIQNLTDHYANKATDPGTPPEEAATLSLVARDLQWALNQSGKGA